jgi:hypothetical protein
MSDEKEHEKPLAFLLSLITYHSSNESPRMKRKRRVQLSVMCRLAVFKRFSSVAGDDRVDAPNEKP